MSSPGLLVAVALWVLLPHSFFWGGASLSPAGAPCALSFLSLSLSFCFVLFSRRPVPRSCSASLPPLAL